MIAFDFSAIAEYANVSVCKLTDLFCLEQIRARVMSIVPPDDAIGFHHIRNKSTLGIVCDCMPGCHETVSFILKFISYSFNRTNSHLKFSNCIPIRGMASKYCYQTEDSV